MHKKCTRFYSLICLSLSCNCDFLVATDSLFFSSEAVKVDDYSQFFFYFLRDQNSQHFNEDLLGVNASAFSFVLCFKAINYAGASSYVISANRTALENF